MNLKQFRKDCSRSFEKIFRSIFKKEKKKDYRKVKIKKRNGWLIIY